MFEFLPKLVEHAKEDDGDGDPLGVIDVVPEDEDAHDDCKYLAGSRDEREDVLLEVGYDVVDRHLSQHLQTTDLQDQPQRGRVVH